MENNNPPPFTFTPFSHDYYIMYLPMSDSKEIYEGVFQYKLLRDFKNRKIKLSPVIRLYGTSYFGLKCCVHIHGVYTKLLKINYTATIFSISHIFMLKQVISQII